MTRVSSGRTEWVLTAAVILAVAAGLATLHQFGRAAERRQREEVARVSRLASLALVGQPAAPVTMVLGLDSVSFPGVSSASQLLYVRGPDCEACDRVDRALIAYLRSHSPTDPVVWVVSETASGVGGDRLSGIPGVQSVRPVDVASFARGYQVHQLPYLALIDASGRIEQVRIGFAKGFDVREFIEAGRK